MAGRLRGNRTVAVTLAIVLVFVPTLFAVFPNFATAPLWVRVLVIVVWGGVAAATAVAARVKDDQRDALATAQFDLVVSEALAGVLAAVGEPYEPAVYLPGREGAPLARFWPPDADADEFPIGVGAVGRCYGTGADQFFVGDAVHSAETGLGLAQQRRYERYVVVGAVPIPSTTAATASIWSWSG